MGGLAACDAVVLGTGCMGKLAVRLLRAAGVGRLSVASRSQERAAEMAAAVRGRTLQTSGVPAALAYADILVTATGAAVPVVLAGHVRAARAQAGGRPLFVLDLGMPPDVDPAVGQLAGVTLVDVAALGRHLADCGMPGQIPEVRAIAAAEAADAELARLHDRLPGLSEDQRAETAATVHRILRKVLHQPTVRAKEFSAGPNGPVYLDRLRQLFDLRMGEAGT
jgi:glutamyl-tRNA reductase